MSDKTGALKTAAKRVGLSVEEYDQRRSAGQKWCYRCREWHPVSWFTMDRSRGDGLKASCMADAAQKASGLKRCPGCGEWIPREGARNGSCTPCVRRYERDRYRDDPTFRAQRAGRSSARRRDIAAVPRIGYEVLSEIWGGKCAYCGDAANSIDHLTPVSKGGVTCRTNVVPACLSCNSSKKNSDPESWIKRGFQLFPEAWIDLLDLLAMEEN